MKRISAFIPRAWSPIALRALAVTAAQISPGLRYHLRRILGSMQPDMGKIERDYPAWIELYDWVNVEIRRAIVVQIARMPHTPLISIVMPVFNPSTAHLLAAVHSVRDQLYPWWELCICDDASTDPSITTILYETAKQDHRIKLVRRERNCHISAASNSALELATGSFVALLDHDDVLPPHALYEVAARIVAQPDVDIIYSDEDHIDDKDRRSHPYFKSDWNFELMLGQNLISHLGVFRRALVEQIGGFRVGFEGSQDYDLALRAVAKTHPDRIAHIAKVLYHWRQDAVSRTFSEKSRDRCVQNAQRAVQEFVTRDQAGAKVEPAPIVPTWTRVVYSAPVPAPSVSVILTGGSSVRGMAACINELLNQTNYPVLEVLIPTGDTKHVELFNRLAQDERRIRCIAAGRSTGKNKAAEEAQGSLLLMLDSHVRPYNAGWLREMVSHAVRPYVGVVGAKLMSPRGTIWHAGIVVGGPDIAFMPFVGRKRLKAGYFGQLQLARNVTAVSGKCMMVHRQTFLTTKGWDESFFSAILADVDLCLKFYDLKLRTVWTPSAELMLCDARPQSTHPVDFKSEAARMRQRWGHRLDADPYWSANLSCDPTELGLAFPPRTGN